MATQISGEAMLQAIRHVEMSRYTKMASTSIILFDHAITFSEEVDLIWKSNWSAGKVLFLLNRYYTIFSVILNTVGYFSDDLTDSFCGTFLQWQGWTGLISCIIAEVILQMRIYAMYSLDKTVLIVMAAAFVTSIGSSAYVMATVLSKVTSIAVPIPGVHSTFCMPRNIANHFYLFWLPMVLFEVLLCGLALARAFSTFVRTEGSHSNVSTGRRLIIVLFRDSVVYFLVICATYLSCLLIWRYAPRTLLEVPVTFTVAMSCVFGNRIILNVRELAADRASMAIVSQQHSSKWNALAPVNASAGDAEIHVSFVSEAGLTEYEMDKLRGLRAARSSSQMSGRWRS